MGGMSLFFIIQLIFTKGGDESKDRDYILLPSDTDTGFLHLSDSKALRVSASPVVPLRFSKVTAHRIDDTFTSLKMQTGYICAPKHGNRPTISSTMSPLCAWKVVQNNGGTYSIFKSNGYLSVTKEADHTMEPPGFKLRIVPVSKNHDEIATKWQMKDLQNEEESTTSQKLENKPKKT